MTPDVRARLHESWELASPHADALATCFYARLFEIDAAAGRLFADTDMVAQRPKFAAMLDRIVRAVDEPRPSYPTWQRSPDGTLAMAWRIDTTPAWARRCCSRSATRLATGSRATCTQRGWKPTHCSQR